MRSYIFNNLSRTIYYNNREKNKLIKLTKIIPYSWYLTDSIKSKKPQLTIRSLSKNSGIIIRPYNLKNKNMYIKNIIKSSRKESLIILIAGIYHSIPYSNGNHVPKWMNQKPNHNKIISVSIHGFKDIRRSMNLKANLAFISPVFETSSHNNKNYIGVVKLGLLSRRFKIPVIALGGINEKNIKLLRSMPIHGCAGIDVYEKQANIC